MCWGALCQLDPSYSRMKTGNLECKKMLPNNWPLGKSVGAFFKLMIDVGRLRSLWAVPFLGK